MLTTCRGTVCPPLNSTKSTSIWCFWKKSFSHTPTWPPISITANVQYLIGQDGVLLAVALKNLQTLQQSEASLCSAAPSLQVPVHSIRHEPAMPLADISLTRRPPVYLTTPRVPVGAVIGAGPHPLPVLHPVRTQQAQPAQQAIQWRTSPLPPQTTPQHVHRKVLREVAQIPPPMRRRALSSPMIRSPCSTSSDCCLAAPQDRWGRSTSPSAGGCSVWLFVQWERGPNYLLRNLRKSVKRDQCNHVK